MQNPGQNQSATRLDSMKNAFPFCNQEVVDQVGTNDVKLLTSIDRQPGQIAAMTSGAPDVLSLAVRGAAGVVG